MSHHLYCYKKTATVVAYTLLLMIAFMVNSYASNKTDTAGTSQYRSAGDYVIYMGVLPAEMILGHVKMHGGVPIGAFRYHVTVAVFDRDTGKRIVNVNVSARISNSSSDTGFKQLQNMAFNKMHVYGNYFKPASPGPYRIQVIVEDKKRTEKVMVEFQYLQAHVHIDN